MNNNNDVTTLNVDVQMQSLTHDAEATLAHVLDIMSALSIWLIRSGIGYTEFSATLKPIFYNEALRELERINQKKTDSSISLLSGISRREVSGFRAANGQHQILENYPDTLPVSVPARVVALWVSSDLPNQILIAGEEESFEYLVKCISTEKHPRSILLELKRLGIVIEDQHYVTLQTSSFTPKAKLNEAKQLFKNNIRDHIAAGVSNLTQYNDEFLEQAVFADELTTESIEKLRQQSVSLWQDMSKQLLSLAIELCRQDADLPNATQCFRFGAYQYNAEDTLHKVFKNK